MRTRNLVLLGCLLAGQAGAAGTSLETDAEKYSYAIGINFAQSLMRQGVPLDADAIYMAIQDALAGGELRLSAESMSDALRAEAQRAGERKREMAGENMRRGKEFMAQNKNKEGVTTLPNGIQYEVLRKGSGAQPKKTDTVTVHYVGTLVDGREFDSSKRRGEPATFPLDGVIQGWQEVLPLMRVGARWLVTIPPDLAYGVNGAGAAIGPNETLVFEIDLLEIGGDSEG
ncbi:MAG: FKBP-type peptidyl-prolyl cis-trans isomerase [Gammaproteobacteria bacterium]